VLLPLKLFETINEERNIIITQTNLKIAAIFSHFIFNKWINHFMIFKARRLLT